MKIRLTLLFYFCVHLFFAQVDTLIVYSEIMKKSIPNLVIKPKNYNQNGNSYPSLYLLHGAGGYFSNWMFRVPEIEQYANDYNIIIVCPDGNKTSWYFDSPIDSSSQYETYIAKELVKEIDHKYNTIRNKKGRAISGLSMGGHGALYLAIRHNNIWGAAGSMSGGVNIVPFAERWNIHEVIGSYKENKAYWENNTVINMIDLIKDDFELIIDCGTSDFFADVNQVFHEKLKAKGVPHSYSVRPGNHNWEYWRESIKEHLLFFDDYFQSNQ